MVDHGIVEGVDFGRLFWREQSEGGVETRKPLLAGPWLEIRGEARLNTVRLSPIGIAINRMKREAEAHKWEHSRGDETRKEVHKTKGQYPRAETYVTLRGTDSRLFHCSKFQLHSCNNSNIVSDRQLLTRWLPVRRWRTPIGRSPV